MHTPIKNVHSVAVKQFSIANAMENIRSGEQTLRWLEVYQPRNGDEASGKIFSVDVPIGYYTAADLCTAINAQISAIPNRRCSDDTNETDATITFLASGTFQIEASLSNQGSGSQGNKYFQPLARGLRSFARNSNAGKCRKTPKSIKKYIKLINYHE